MPKNVGFFTLFGEHCHALKMIFFVYPGLSAQLFVPDWMFPASKRAKLFDFHLEERAQFHANFKNPSASVELNCSLVQNPLTFTNPMISQHFSARNFEPIRGDQVSH